MSGYGTAKRGNQNGFNFRTTSARMQLEHRAGVLQYPSPKRSRHAAEEFQGCTDVIADISRNVKKRDKLNTASSAKEIEESQSNSNPEESEGEDRQYYSSRDYSDKYSKYSDYSQTNYYDYYQNNYSENQYSASVHSYDDENYDDPYHSYEEEEEEYLSESEKIDKPDDVKLSSFDEEGKSNPIERDLDEGQTSSVQLRSLDNEDENEDEDENESNTISGNNERNQSSSRSNKNKSQKEDSEKAPSVKERNASISQKETDNTNTDSNRSGSRQRKKRSDSLGNSDSIKEDAQVLSEIDDEDKSDAITNSNSNYNSTQKSEASQHSSSKPARGRIAKREVAPQKDNDKEEKAGNLSERFDLLIQANQKLVAAVLANQKAIFDETHNSYSEEALKHIQAAYDILTNNNNNNH